MIVVDLAAQCIEACRKRFAESHHITYHVNDGLSLECVSPHSVDFVFSYDSLVHAEAAVLQSYLRTAGGKADARRGRLYPPLQPRRDRSQPAPGEPPPDIHWRAHDMSAARFVEFCSEAGLRCIAQEIVDWGGEPRLDCFSVFTLPGSRFARPLRVDRDADVHGRGRAPARDRRAVRRRRGGRCGSRFAPSVLARLSRWLRAAADAGAAVSAARAARAGLSRAAHAAGVRPRTWRRSTAGSVRSSAAHRRSRVGDRHAARRSARRVLDEAAQQRRQRGAGIGVAHALGARGW